ncbi:winged helix-turn-helix domain-containing protein [Saccharopolyspora elongata]|uniref:Transposase n=1 Tax=Saccharopolyspora elongata TaxID=2530387 RepID=A0A4R4YCN0_9PSEU|nr:winged helix-turn-helix domain-containing protein [Saccharopolyspora elongata]TDD42375.1 transposase [Saccharopolyspora elongata]
MSVIKQGVPVRRDRAAMESVRLAAAELFEQGYSQAEVARLLETSRQNVHRWHEKWQRGGREELVSVGPPGRAPKLDEQQLRHVRDALLAGARSNGFDQDLWTLRRIATVIERITGVQHHPGHVWYILRDRLGWSAQRPARRAVERDEDAIETWVGNDWPRIKKTPSNAERGSSSSTSPDCH